MKFFSFLLFSLLQSFYLKLIGHRQEFDKVLVLDLYLPAVDELHQGPQGADVDTLQHQERVLVGVEQEDVLEEGAARAQDHLVTFNLAAIGTRERDVGEVFVVVEISKRFHARALKVVPSQVHQLGLHLDGLETDTSI